MNYLLTQVADYSRFLTYDEIQENIMQLTQSPLNLGVASDGRSIIGCKIGKGKETALVFGFPHPNEPVGSLTCLELIKLLQQNERIRNKYTWYIIPCPDPFGAGMNEGWFKENFSISEHFYNFYRPEAKRQIEWSFPVQYKDYTFSTPPAETRMLADLMNEIKPAVVYPLHNAGIGGAFFYLTKKMPDKYYNNIVNLCNELKIPLDYGEPETEFVKEQKKPFYWSDHLEDMYEYLKSLGENPCNTMEGGNNTLGYAKSINPNVFGVVGEVPFMYDEKIFDATDTDEKRRKYVREKYELEEKLLGFIMENIDKDFIKKDNVFYPALKELLSMELEIIKSSKQNINIAEYDRNITVAEKFSSMVSLRFDLCRFVGEFYRLLLLSEETDEVQRLKSKTQDLITEQINFIEKNSDLKTIPIRDLVQIQLGCFLEAVQD